MRVAMTTFGGDGGRSGISRYIIQLMSEFARAPEGMSLDVLLYESERDVFIPKDAPFDSLAFPESLKPPVRNILWHQRCLQRICTPDRYDLLFLPAANRRLPYTSRIKTVGCVHDFSAIHLAGKYDRGRMFYIRHVLPRLVRRLDHVVTVSESSARDIIEFARVPEERVTVTPLGVDHSRFNTRIDDATKKAVAARYGLAERYLLYTSRLEHPGKNHVRLIQAFERLTSSRGGDVQLVLAGSPWLRTDAIEDAVRTARPDLKIHFTGFVDDADLPALYAGAEAFIFPSLYEGFGLPILEAMACGIPVACSDVSSMPEVAKGAGVLFAPDSVDAMTDALECILTDAATRERCRAAGLARARAHTWQRCAQQTKNVFRRVLGEDERTFVAGNQEELPTSSESCDDRLSEGAPSHHELLRAGDHDGRLNDR